MTSCVASSKPRGAAPSTGSAPGSSSRSSATPNTTAASCAFTAAAEPPRASSGGSWPPPTTSSSSTGTSTGPATDAGSRRPGPRTLKPRLGRGLRDSLTRRLLRKDPGGARGGRRLAGPRVGGTADAVGGGARLLSGGCRGGGVPPELQEVVRRGDQAPFRAGGGSAAALEAVAAAVELCVGGDRLDHAPALCGEGPAPGGGPGAAHESGENAGPARPGGLS